MKAASDVLTTLIEWLDRIYVPTKPTPKKGEMPAYYSNSVEPSTEDFTLKYTPQMGKNRALRDALRDVQYQLGHLHALEREPTAPKFDPNLTREEFRDVTIGGKRHCLVTKQVVTPAVHKSLAVDVGVRPKNEKTEAGVMTRTFKPGEDDWNGDQFVIEHSGNYKMAAKRQTRTLTQSRLFITYSLHRRVQDARRDDEAVRSERRAATRARGNRWR